jgi:uncharacterized protein (TIGR00106 family)
MIIAEISFIPMGAGVSLSSYIAEALKIIEASGLKYEFHSMGTNVEGEFDEVMALVKRCHERFFEMGVPRVSTSLKISQRRDKVYTMAGKVASVREAMKER